MEKIKKINVSQELGIGSIPLGNKVNELIDGYNKIADWIDKQEARYKKVNEWIAGDQRRFNGNTRVD